MTDNHLSVDPEEMARAGQALREPGQLIRQAFMNLASERGDIRRIWGSGDDISDSLNENLTPRVEMLDEFGEALIIAFDRTTDVVLRSARGFGVSEENAWDLSDGLDTAPGPGGTRR